VTFAFSVECVPVTQRHTSAADLTGDKLRGKNVKRSSLGTARETPSETFAIFAFGNEGEFHSRLHIWCFQRKSRGHEEKLLNSLRPHRNIYGHQRRRGSEASSYDNAQGESVSFSLP
jgi:hypothetical protein